jgi:hypothetical protein
VKQIIAPVKRNSKTMLKTKRLAMQCVLFTSATRHTRSPGLDDWVEVVSLEALVTNNLADYSLDIEFPGTLIGIRESSIAVRTPFSHDGLSSFIKNLAAEILLLGPSANDDLDSLEGTTGSLGLGLNTRTLFQCSPRAELNTLILEKDANLEVRRIGFDENGIADDLADFALLPEGPFTLAAICEGDIGILATDDNDVVTLIIEDLAAKVFALDILAETELDGLEGSAGAGGAALLALSLSESGLRARFGGLVAENDSDGIVQLGLAQRGCDDIGSGESSKEERCVLHVEGIALVRLY